MKCEDFDPAEYLEMLEREGAGQDTGPYVIEAYKCFMRKGEVRKRLLDHLDKRRQYHSDSVALIKKGWNKVEAEVRERSSRTHHLLPLRLSRNVI